MGCDEQKYYDANQVVGAFILIKKTKDNIDFLQMYMNYCKDIRLISDNPNECGYKNLPDFIDHRHDQSILSLLCCRFGIPFHKDPSQFGREMEHVYTNDRYDIMINHVRSRD
jgi:hypothetical protein